MNVAIRTLKAILRQIDFQMSDGAIAKNTRFSKITLCKIKKNAESTNLSISEHIQQVDSDLKKLLKTIKTNKGYQKKIQISLIEYKVNKIGC